MKKQVILMAAAAAVTVPMIADAQILPAAGATVDLCQNGAFITGAMTTDPGTNAQFLKKSFKVACSSNVDLVASETNLWLTVASASRKGKYIMGGNTDGSSPSCLKAARTDTKCDDTPANLVDPVKPANHIAIMQAAAVSGAGSTSAKFSPCFLQNPAPNGC